MRKNTARKWVHLLLDLLPVLIIPIFAIYLINHNPQGLQVQTGGYEYTEKFTTNAVSDPSTDLINGNTYLFRVDLSYSNSNSQDIYIFNGLEEPVYFEITDMQGSFVPKINLGTNYVNTLRFKPYWYSTALDIFATLDVESEITYQLYSSGTLDYNSRNGFVEFICTYNNFYSSIFDDYVSVRALPSEYLTYEATYNEGMIYANTDIGSQLVYSMYIPVHDYFNMTSLFNFGDIYTWINTSMFNANAPLPIFIVYNVIVYEFLIDLIFLIYSIFMFIIDFTSELLARCFSFSNKGGTR